MNDDKMKEFLNDHIKGRNYGEMEMFTGEEEDIIKALAKSYHMHYVEEKQNYCELTMKDSFVQTIIHEIQIASSG